MNVDPYLHLEQIDDPKVLEWVEAHNKTTKEIFTGNSAFEQLQDKLRSALDSDLRIPQFLAYGQFLYNHWQDPGHPRGVWRRTTLEEFKIQAPKWEVLLDIDRLAEDESENWVFAGHAMCRPQCERALIYLSRGGGDAIEIREFDVNQKDFVNDGFFLPEAKSHTNWAGHDQLLVSTDFGPGTMTESGYPMTVRCWQRGTELKEAQELFRGEETDVYTTAWSDPWCDFKDYYIHRGVNFFANHFHIYRDGEAIQLNKPDSANVSIHRGRLLIRLTEDWQTDDQLFLEGSLLIGDLNDYLDGKCKLQVLFEPASDTFLEGWSNTQSTVLLSIQKAVRTKGYRAIETVDGWDLSIVRDSADLANETIQPLDGHDSDHYLLGTQSFLEPPTLMLGGHGNAPTLLKEAPNFFNTEGLETQQLWAISKDGTQIPYFLIHTKNSNGAQPTVLYGYGGFEISLLPMYSPTIGLGWLERGGSFVLANIRGGGEFGPTWHRQALKENRNLAYEDFIAVAEDLIARGLTDTSKLAIQGGSNGGLLMGNMYTQRPDLFAAIVCQVPLLDMSRYHKLLAGASWVAEYGNPDLPEEWAYLKHYSPYHNVRKDLDYPSILITTSTRDDRVHPGHARKMVARLQEYGHDVLYYENTAGGHAGAADNSQRAYLLTLVYEFLSKTLGLNT